MDTLLIDVTARIETERLVLRCPPSGEGEALNQAVGETLDELRNWMPRAQSAPSQDDVNRTHRAHRGQSDPPRR